MPPLLIAVAIGAVVAALALTWILFRRDPDART